MSGKKILVITSNAEFIQLQSGKLQKTGTFLSELMEPILILEQNGFNVVLASPNGRPPVLDPMSEHLLWFGFSSERYQDVRNAFSRLCLQPTLTLSSIDTAELATFSGVFIPGGHAPTVDLVENPDVGRILAYFHTTGKPIAAVCHGPAALLSAKDASGRFLFADYRITAYSNLEEKMNEWMWWDHVPYYLQDRLQCVGARYEKTLIPGMAYVAVDRELITGQGPTSAQPLARKFVSVLGCRFSDRILVE